jgi:hypothetical protein
METNIAAPTLLDHIEKIVTLTGKRGFTESNMRIRAGGIRGMRSRKNGAEQSGFTGKAFFAYWYHAVKQLWETAHEPLKELLRYGINNKMGFTSLSSC